MHLILLLVFLLQHVSILYLNHLLQDLNDDIVELHLLDLDRQLLVEVKVADFLELLSAFEQIRFQEFLVKVQTLESVALDAVGVRRPSVFELT